MRRRDRNRRAPPVRIQDDAAALEDGSTVTGWSPCNSLSLTGICPGEAETHVHAEVWAESYTVASFVITERVNNPNAHHLTGAVQMWYSRTTEYYPAAKQTNKKWSADACYNMQETQQPCVRGRSRSPATPSTWFLHRDGLSTDVEPYVSGGRGPGSGESPHVDAETPLKVMDRLDHGGGCTATTVNRSKKKKKSWTADFKRVNFVIYEL